MKVVLKLSQNSLLIIVLRAPINMTLNLNSRKNNIDFLNKINSKINFLYIETFQNRRENQNSIMPS